MRDTRAVQTSAVRGLDEDDGNNFCVPGTDSTLVMIDGCFGDDGDWDGQSYRLDWPGTNPNVTQDQALHPSPVLFTSPLANGTTLSYAFGLTVGEYRGMPLVEHGGSSGGYRTIISRFPTAHTSVVALCNSSDANTTMLSHRVADVVLGPKFTLAAGPPRPRPGTNTVTVFRGASDPARTFAPLVGRYYSEELDATYEILVSGQSLTVRRPRGEVDTLMTPGTTLGARAPAAPDALTFRGGGLTYHFAPNAGSSSPSFTVDIGRARGMEFKRVARAR